MIKHEALEIIDLLHQGNVICNSDYLRLHDFVECLIGDFKTLEQIRERDLQKLDAIREMLK